METMTGEQERTSNDFYEMFTDTLERKRLSAEEEAFARQFSRHTH